MIYWTDTVLQAGRICAKFLARLPAALCAAIEPDEYDRERAWQILCGLLRLVQLGRLPGTLFAQVWMPATKGKTGHRATMARVVQPLGMASSQRPVGLLALPSIPLIEEQERVAAHLVKVLGPWSFPSSVQSIIFDYLVPHEGSYGPWMVKIRGRPHCPCCVHVL